MDFNDEKDIIMRMIKEMARVLFSLILGKRYEAAEAEKENKYEVAGKALEEFKAMVDQGLINEAENELSEKLDHTQKEEILTAVLFYQYGGEKEEDFLALHNYSKEEALEGLKTLAEKAGYGEMDKIFQELW